MGRHARLLIDGATFFEGPRWRDGRWWVSDFYRHVVQTVTPDGDVERIIEVPGQPSGLGWAPSGEGVFACMLGGEDGRTLLACCAPDVDENARAASREASLWTLEVDVPGAGLP